MNRCSTNDAARVRVLSLGATVRRRGATIDRLHGMGLEVVPFQDPGEAVDLVVVHRGEGDSATSAVASSLSRVPAPHVVLSETAPDSAELIGVVSVGARGWVSELVSDHALAGAVRDVLGGAMALSRAHVDVVVKGLQRRSERTLPRIDGRTVQLSDREWEVLQSLAAGVTGTQTAALLGVSPAAVRGYVASAVRRLGTSSRSETVSLFTAGAYPGLPAP